MVDKKFRIHRDEFSRVCKYGPCSKTFMTFVRTQEYCCAGCRYENQKIVEAAKTAAKKAETRKRIEDRNNRRERAEQVLAERKAEKVRQPHRNNTPTRKVNPRAGKRPCGNCGVIFHSVDKVCNQRCAKCRALAESASGMREIRIGR